MACEGGYFWLEIVVKLTEAAPILKQLLEAFSSINEGNLLQTVTYIQANIFHYGYISLIEEPCKSVHLAAMSIAKKSGSMLSYDPNLRLPLWPSPEAARKGIMSIWDQ
ncbi:hypothetical protein GOBAR_DD16888 [Gossypium barbadense]|nr:hypothetical protein GOBAR_DD16888 [Gossypium barbadense]